MKNLFVFFLSLLFFSTQVSAQSLATIRDPNYKGVKVFEDGGYRGASVPCTVEGNIYSFPQGIGSVKVYGAWKLVHQTNGLEITADDVTYNGSGSGSWKLERTNDKYFGIAYTGVNYTGEATYLKMYKNENLHSDMKSLKLGMPANLGWSQYSGYQTKYQSGDYSTLPYDLARVDINIRYKTRFSVN